MAGRQTQQASAAVQFEAVQKIRAPERPVHHLRGQRAGVIVGHIVRPHQHVHRIARRAIDQRHAVDIAQFGADPATLPHPAGQQNALADETGDEAVGGPVVQIVRAIPLQQPALVQHPDLVGEGEGFELIVADQQAADTLAQQNGANLAGQAFAQRDIQAGKRLVQQ